MNDSQIWGLGLWISCALIGSLIACALIDGQGRDARQHSEAMPAHVEQLSPTAYLIEKGGPEPLEICRGTKSGGERLNSTKELTRIEGEPTFVECSRSQEWSVGGDRSNGFDDAIVTFSTSPVVWGIAGGSLFLFMLPGNLEALGDRRRRRAIEKRQCEEQEHARLDFDRKRQLLTEAWSADGSNITDLEFENKLQTLMDEAGIKELP